MGARFLGSLTSATIRENRQKRAYRIARFLDMRIRSTCFLRQIGGLVASFHFFSAAPKAIGNRNQEEKEEVETLQTKLSLHLVNQPKASSERNCLSNCIL